MGSYHNFTRYIFSAEIEKIFKYLQIWRKSWVSWRQELQDCQRLLEASRKAAIHGNLQQSDWNESISSALPLFPEILKYASISIILKLNMV